MLLLTRAVSFLLPVSAFRNHMGLAAPGTPVKVFLLRPGYHCGRWAALAVAFALDSQDCQSSSSWSLKMGQAFRRRFSAPHSLNRLVRIAVRRASDGAHAVGDLRVGAVNSRQP